MRFSHGTITPILVQVLVLVDFKLSCIHLLITEYHKLGVLEQQEFIVSQFWSPEV